MAEDRSLTSERRSAGIAAGLGALATAILAVVFLRERAPSFFVLLLTIFGISTLTVAIGQRRCQVGLDDDALRVTGALFGRNREYRWDDLLEIGYNAPETNWVARLGAIFLPSLSIGFMILVRPTGGRFDVPGPNAPAAFATLAIFGSEAKRAAEQLLRDECLRHGVAFSDRGLRMLDDAPPGSPLRRANPRTGS